MNLQPQFMSFLTISALPPSKKDIGQQKFQLQIYHKLVKSIHPQKNCVTTKNLNNQLRTHPWHTSGLPRYYSKSKKDLKQKFITYFPNLCTNKKLPFLNYKFITSLPNLCITRSIKKKNLCNKKFNHQFITYILAQCLNH